jgi:predicted metal-binding membrane protein
VSTDLTQLEAVLRRDRAIILAGVAVVALAAWAYLIYLVREMALLARPRKSINLGTGIN